MAESDKPAEAEIASMQVEGDREVSANDLGYLLWRVSAYSTHEIDNLIGELQTLSDRLHATSGRVEREVMEHAALGESVRQLTKVLADSVTQVKKVPDAASLSE